MTVLLLVSSSHLPNDVIESLAKRIRGTLNGICLCRIRHHCTPAYTTAASLLQNGVVGSLERMHMHYLDLSSVPAEHLALLASNVTTVVSIRNVSNTDLSPILDNLKCIQFDTSGQSLGREETQALVRSMESNIERVTLGWVEVVNLDIMALTQYNGEGRCWLVKSFGETSDRYREEMWSWAWRIKWVADAGIDGNHNEDENYIGIKSRPIPIPPLTFLN